jgi:hypothetical protein
MADPTEPRRMSLIKFNEGELFDVDDIEKKGVSVSRTSVSRTSHGVSRTVRSRPCYIKRALEFVICLDSEVTRVH